MLVIYLSSIKKCILTISALIFLNYTLYAQESKTFPISEPEAQGVSSASIDSFLNAVGRSKNEFHSFMFLRHGKVIAQGWWNPYAPDLTHSLYSCSKSFTSTAVGFAISEKLLSVNDKVISFFPGSLPDSVTSYLATLTVKDLLTMSVGQEPDPTAKLAMGSDNWVKDFLALPIKYTPGSKFLYNTMATYMLSAIVQKVTGQREFDYLKPRLFDPLDIKGIDWEVNTQGVNTGGWGLRLKTEDLAKMGQLYLQKGMWNGKQLLPKTWIEEATTFKIDQAPGVPESKRDSSDWMQGYCYQFWRCRHNAFRADGAFGQYIIVMPDQDAVIAITSETSNMQDELNLVWEYLLPAMQPQVLPVNKSAEKNLKEHLAALNLPPLSNNINDNVALSENFMIDKNELNINSISLKSHGKSLDFTLNVDTGKYTFKLASGKWQADKTKMQGPYLLLNAKEDFSILSPYKVEGSYGWKDSSTLQLKLRYIESPHTEIITLHFNDKQLNADVEYSFNYGSKKISLHGIQAK